MQYECSRIKLGLKENWKQFTLLVIVNGFVGGMVGMERSILPQIAEKEFAIAAKTAILSFIIVFGIVKAVTNYYTGALANRFGRKNLLVAGWIIGIPIPFMLMFAPIMGLDHCSQCAVRYQPGFNLEQYRGNEN